MTGGLVYLDSSALIKLIFGEAETEALERFLIDWPNRTSSSLARVEVLRAAARVHDPLVAAYADEVLAGIDLIRVDEGFMAAAAQIEPPTLGSLDSIHLATALSLGSELGGIVAYDRRLTAAARRAGLTVWAPA